MKRKSVSSIFAVLLAGALLFVLETCHSSSGGSASGELVGRTDCKSSLSPAAPGGAAKPVTAAGRECVTYEYDGLGVLTLKHVDAGFNCCPGTISADFTISSTEIRIRETESSSLCDCECLFDLDYEFVNIRPGTYTIAITGPYQVEGDAPLEFTVELTRALSGSFCVERTHYPWSI